MRWLVAAWLAAWALAGPALAERPPEFNVDVRVGWQGAYRPTEWTPVEITITRVGDDPFGGMLTVSATQDDGSEMAIHHRIVITPGLPLYVPLVTKVGFAADSLTATITDDRGRRRWSKEVGLWDPETRVRALLAIAEDEMLIGVAGPLGFGLRTLGEHTRCAASDELRSRGMSSASVSVMDKSLPLLPWDWTGYTGLDLLVLYDLDWQRLDRHQSEAIARWVNSGGHLLIVLGGHPLPDEHPLAGLLPFRLGGATELTVDGPAAAKWGCGDKPVTVPSWLDPAQVTKGGWGMADGPPVFAFGPVGFGMVGVLGFDPSVLSASTYGHPREKQAAFWLSYLNELGGPRTLELIRKDSPQDNNRTSYPYGNSWYRLGSSSAAANGVMDHLLDMQELKPLSIWVIIGLLGGMAILLGPVDYFILKKLDRQPLTWLTSLVLIAVCTVGAYYGVEALRSGPMRVRAVTVQDAIQGQPQSWSTSYAGLYAPASDQYKLTGLSSGQWWSSIAPNEGDLYMYGRRRMPARRLDCLQNEGGNLPGPVPINIWSVRCLLSESSADAVPLAAEVTRDGETVQVKLTNLSDKPLTDAWARLAKPSPADETPQRNARLKQDPTLVRRRDLEVRTGRRPGSRQDRSFLEMRLGPLGPGETRTFDGNPEPSAPWGSGAAWERMRNSMYYGGYYGEGRRPPFFAAYMAYLALGSDRRTRAIEGYLDRGAAVICASFDGASPFGVEGRTARTDHLHLVRLVVWPKEGSSK